MESYGALSLYILRKLSPTVRQCLAREHGSEEWSLDDLRKDLQREIVVLEAGQAGSGLSNVVGGRATISDSGQHSSTAMHVAASGQKYPCFLCKDVTHRVKHCQKFVGANEKMSVFRQEKHCFRCLSDRHSATDCKTNRTCFTFKGLHHTCLHIGTIVSEVPLLHHRDPRRPSCSGFGLVNSARGDNESVIIRPSTVVLKTAVTIVSSQERNGSANLLHDNASQHTFITVCFNLGMGFKVVGYDSSCISSFGSRTQSSTVRDVVELSLIANTL